MLRIHVKGAPEIVLNSCTKMLSKGQEHILDSTKKQQILTNVIEKFSSKSLRTIAIAYKDTQYKGS